MALHGTTWHSYIEYLSIFTCDLVYTNSYTQLTLSHIIIIIILLFHFIISILTTSTYHMYKKGGKGTVLLFNYFKYV